MIRNLKKNISIPLIIGGGIRTAAKAKEIYEAGADIIVIGNAIEKDDNLIKEMANAIHAVKVAI
jgi:putative glycerol-1-phosphate prenyltransferase